MKKDHMVILIGDMNARCREWDDTTQNERGNRLQELAGRCQLTRLRSQDNPHKWTYQKLVQGKIRWSAGD